MKRHPPYALALTIISLVSLPLFGLAPAGTPNRCPDLDRLQTKRVWMALQDTVAKQYLAPSGLDAGSLTGEMTAKIFGYALARQAHYVGDDERKKAAFDCLGGGVEEVLTRLDADLGALLPDDSVAGRKRLAAVFFEARSGFFDDELEHSLSIPAVDAPSVFEDLADWPLDHVAPLARRATGPSDATPTVAPPQPSPERLSAPPTRCRLSLDPDLLSGVAPPDSRWSLIRKPWRGDGFYYFTVESKPSRKRELKPGYEVVLEGSRDEVLARGRVIGETCR